MAMMPTFDTDSEDELPAGWEERVTLEGKVYYANHHNLGTQWDHPISGKKKRVAGELPYGWERKINQENLIYFVDHISQKTTYTDPRLAFAVEEKDGKSREIKQRFDGSTAALQVLQGRDLTGQYVVITGANSGIGFETARTMAMHGAHVTLACRDSTKAYQAMNLILKERPQAQLSVLVLDLCRLDSVRDFAQAYINKNWPLHILVLNAGVFSLPHATTDDGYEATFQTNHLGHFYLTQSLIGVLKKSTPARIVTVTAESHRFTDLNNNTISLAKLSPPLEGYRPILAYNQSKLCNVLFTQQCHRLYASKGVTANALHPGNIISTGLTRHWWFWKLLYTLVRPFSKSKQQGASTTVFVATAHELDGVSGYYFNNCFQCPPGDEGLRTDTASKLWALSEQMIQNAKTLQT